MSDTAVSEENAKIKSSVYERGKNGSSKYFLIPKILRENIKLKKEVTCFKLDCKDKIGWVYFMDKFGGKE